MQGGEQIDSGLLWGVKGRERAEPTQSGLSQGQALSVLVVKTWEYELSGAGDG